MVARQRITTKSTTLTSFVMDYRVRSMQFAACWLLRSFDSGKLHCVLLVNVVTNIRSAQGANKSMTITFHV